jgi:hypothetical protein
MNQSVENAYWPEPHGDAEGEADSVGDDPSDGDADGEDSSVAFFDGEGLGEAFFVELELVLVLPVDFLPVEEVVVDDFFVVAVAECAVDVATVSSLCAQEVMKATPARTAVSPSTNFFIDNRYFRVRRLRLFNSLPNGKSFVQVSL